MVLSAWIMLDLQRGGVVVTTFVAQLFGLLPRVNRATLSFVQSGVVPITYRAIVQ